MSKRLGSIRTPVEQPHSMTPVNIEIHNAWVEFPILDAKTRSLKRPSWARRVGPSEAPRAACPSPKRCVTSRSRYMSRPSRAQGRRYRSGAAGNVDVTSRRLSTVRGVCAGGLLVDGVGTGWQAGVIIGRDGRRGRTLKGPSTALSSPSGRAA